MSNTIKKLPVISLGIGLAIPLIALLINWRITALALFYLAGNLACGGGEFEYSSAGLLESICRSNLSNSVKMSIAIIFFAFIYLLAFFLLGLAARAILNKIKGHRRS